MRFLRLFPAVLLTSAMLPLSLRAQPATPTGVTVSGTVYDSLARAPLAGAEVQLVPVDAASGANGGRALIATTDVAGRYRIDSVPTGRYRAGFFHPRVDSLGIGIAPVAVTLRGDAQIGLGFPSALGVQRQLCSASEISDSTALLVGFVRDAATREPRQGATVRLQWTELVIADSKVRHERPEIVVRTRGDGWYGVCGVPTTTGDGDLGIAATSGADSSAVVPLRIGAGVLRRDVYVGRATAPSATASATTHGDARVLGVIRGANGKPVPGARIQLVGGSVTAATDASGAFTLAGQAAGSQVLDVRAIGYVPVQVAVDLLDAGAPNAVAVTMTRVKTYLDTVRIAARSTYDADRTGFERRRRTLRMAYFMDRKTIARRNAVRTTDLFGGLSGVRLVYGLGGQPTVRMRTTAGETCGPAIFIDGMPLVASAASDPLAPAGGLNDIDLFTSPDRLHGVEIYRDASITPGDFRRFGGDCGAIVLWTRPDDRSPRRVANR